ncbi:hypothetical protein [Klebsiella electrica]|uniref:hypothetical protein n=1 Tax=Klebsiella electrica TaxID=1259973 RepID=UPI00114DC361|nr:hypothetical protein [Klebsiella electrica]
MKKLIFSFITVLSISSASASGVSENRILSLSKCLGYSASFDKETLNKNHKALSKIFKSYLSAAHEYQKTDEWLANQKDFLFNTLDEKEPSPDFYAGYFLSTIMLSAQDSIRKSAEAQFVQNKGVGDLSSLWNEEALKRFTDSNCELIN